MNAHDIERLVQQLQTSAITECEFDDRSGARLRLRFQVAEGDKAARREEAGVIEDSAASVSRISLTAPRFGHFLHRHPSSATGAVEMGRNVVKEETVGFIKAGDLLAPVMATHAGRLTEILVADGSLVGYGEALVALE